MGSGHMDIPYGGLEWNDATDDELWAHRLDVADALDVWDGPAKYFRQRARTRAGRGVRRAPRRILMIGPDRGGRLLSFILELPGRDDVSHVVTGWESDEDERTRYARPGGRLRTR